MGKQISGKASIPPSKAPQADGGAHGQMHEPLGILHFNPSIPCGPEDEKKWKRAWGWGAISILWSPTTS